MYRVIVRIETTPDTAEYGKPLLILLDASANWGKVAYCSWTGHGEGLYYPLMKQSRKATPEEVENALKLYGYDVIEDLKVVDKLRKWKKLPSYSLGSRGLKP